MYFAGVSVNAVTPHGETLLHLCAVAGKQSIAVYLIETQNVDDAYINKQTESGSTSLAGVATDTSGWTALHLLCALGLVNFVQYLLDKGADKSIKTVKGQTAADIAKYFKQDKVLPVLGVKVVAPRRTGPRTAPATAASGAKTPRATAKQKSGHWNL